MYKRQGFTVVDLCYFKINTHLHGQIALTLLKLFTDIPGTILSIKIYDPASQVGENACSVNRGNCSHLCLPISATERTCYCATGYMPDASDNTKCIGL